MQKNLHFDLYQLNFETFNRIWLHQLIQKFNMTNKCFSATSWSNRFQKNPPHKHRKPLKLCVIIFKSLFQQRRNVFKLKLLLLLI